MIGKRKYVFTLSLVWFFWFLLMFVFDLTTFSTIKTFMFWFSDAKQISSSLAIFEPYLMWHPPFQNHYYLRNLTYSTSDMTRLDTNSGSRKNLIVFHSDKLQNKLMQDVVAWRASTDWPFIWVFSPLIVQKFPINGLFPARLWDLP